MVDAAGELSATQRRTIARAWRRIGPWFTPILVLLELLGVIAGLISIRQAVTIFVVVEGILVSVTMVNLVAGVNEYRSGRKAGADRWLAIEDGLARLIPRRAARALLTEAKLWTALVQWVSGRPKSASDTKRFTYLTQIQPILLVILALLFVEGVVVEVILAYLLGNSVLVWILLGVHVYALIWIAGFLGSLRTCPHTITGAAITLRDSVFTELVIASEMVASVRTIRVDALSRTGYNVDTKAGTAVMAYGTANVELRLHPNAEFTRDGSAERQVELVRVTVDDPHAFIAAVEQIACP